MLGELIGPPPTINGVDDTHPPAAPAFTPGDAQMDALPSWEHGHANHYSRHVTSADPVPVQACHGQPVGACVTAPQARTYQIGDVAVTRIDELTLNVFSQASLYPGSDPAALERNRAKLSAGSVEAETGNLLQSIHTWLVRTPRHTILIDTATGNDKHRPGAPVLDQLNEPYLARLGEAGVEPEAVDYVLMTHLHADHVGWNTRLIDGRWMPTFPNAKYVFSSLENAYNEVLADGRTPEGKVRPSPALGPMLRIPSEFVYNDSVRPVIEAGLATMISIDGQEFLDGVSFLRTPGHSIDHASIRLVSKGQDALFAGDVMHHPLQVYETDLTSCFCEFPQAAVTSRLAMLKHAADRGAVVFTSHFAETSAGHVSRAGDDFTWHFV